MKKVKVNIVADLIISCYNCDRCKDINTDSEFGEYYCAIDNKAIFENNTSRIYNLLPCNGMFWKWDGDDRGQKTLEDCDRGSMKVVSIR